MATVLHGLRVHSFVLMNNHFHLLASTPNANLSIVMKRFMEVTSKRIGERSKRINRIWGARHYRSVLEKPNHHMNVYKYNYFNPVKAGVVARCEDYPFSTLRALLGAETLLMPIELDHSLMDDPEGTLEWLNRHPTAKQLISMQAALKKARFQHAKCHHSRKQVIRDDELI